VQPITGSPTACVSGTTQLANATPGGTWSSSDNGIATVSPSGLVTGVSVGAVTISYAVTGTCGTTTVTQQVNITTTPTLPAITGTPNVCVNATTQLSNTTPGGTWSSSNNAVATVNSSTGLVTGVSSGNATITYAVTSSCGTATTTQQITVTGPPSVQPITGGNSVCVNGTLQLSNATGGGVWTSSDNNIATVNGAGTVTGISQGSVNINYAVTGTCGTTTVSQSITVNALPAVPAITGASSVCVGATTQLANALAGGTWSSSNASVATVNASSGLVNGVAQGNATITYTVTQNGCTGNNSTQITVNALPVVASAVATDVLCSGGTNGSIVVSGSGGNPPYTYSIDNGQNFQNNGTFNGLTANNYNVFISDAAGCSAAFAFNPVVVNEPTALAQNNTVNNSSCANVFDGKITVNASGGTPPYSYSLNGGAPQPSNIFSGLQSGTYTVQVIDANGCTNTTTQNIDTTFAVSASIVNQTNISCFGASDGSVEVQLSGGLQPYSYSINGVQFVASPVFSGLAAGNYLITLRDSKGCTDFVNVNISQPTVLSISINNITNVLCGGDSTGSISVLASGGNAPYTFTWSNGGNTSSISNLKASNYTVTVADANNCTATRDVAITQPIQLFAVVASFQDVQCAGDSSGYVDVSVSGGTPPYSFNWNTGATTEDIIKLAKGTYTITVSDANNCTVKVSQTIAQPSPLNISASVTNAACFGETGGIDVSISGGVQPYTYVWSNGATSQDVLNITAGAYIVTVTDNNQCSKQLVNVVNQPDEISVAANITNTSCNGGNIGAIDISVSGGSGNFTYQWSANAGNATTQDVNNLSAGTYTVTITDGSQCTKISSFEVKASSNQLIIDLAEVDPICHNGRNGFITVFVSGGTAPYSYTWSNGQTKNTASNLESGVYSVTVKDAKGCEATASGEIKEPLKIDISILASGSKCKNIGTGEVNISVNGGVAPFTYQLNGVVQSSPNFNKLLPGSYSILVRDANGCEATTSFAIKQTTDYSVKLSSDKVVILSGMEAQLNAVAISDAPVLNYFWSPPGNYNFEGCADTLNCPNPKVAPSTTSIYTVTILNADSCVATDTVLITVVREPSEFIPTAFSPNGDGLNDRFEFDILGAESADVSIYNRWGGLVYSNPNQPNGISGNIGWDGTFKGKPLESETFVYTIVVKYFNRVEKRFTGTVTLLR
jgi:gliding motility-associated-like protein